MSKTKTSSKPAASFDLVSFSIVQLPVDQNSSVPSQRILQIVTRGEQTKQYVTEASYFRGELYLFLSKFLEESYEKNIRKNKPALGPVAGGRYWVHFNDATHEGKPQKRVNPESFE